MRDRRGRCEGRGFTLIELMISVALIGIALGTLGGAVALQQRASASVVLRERALQLLEAQADALLHGAPLTGAQLAALKAELPEGALAERSEGGLRILSASWKEQGGRQSLELVLVEGRR
jgi:prepilin-type N-terminal cleavage/methylation domain-containing protein